MAHHILHGSTKSVGEKLMLKYLASHLPDDWIIVSNCEVGRTTRDNREIDAIIISRRHIWVVDAKSRKNGKKIIIDKSLWTIEGVRKEKSPVLLQQDTARLVKGILKEICPRVWVEPLILLSNDHELVFKDAEVAKTIVRPLENCEQYFLSPGLSAGNDLSLENQFNIVAKLIGEDSAVLAFQRFGLNHPVRIIGQAKEMGSAGNNKPSYLGTSPSRPSLKLVSSNTIDSASKAAQRTGLEFICLESNPQAQATVESGDTCPVGLDTEDDPLRQLHNEAEAGDADAQYELGKVYEEGVSRTLYLNYFSDPYEYAIAEDDDVEEALKWFQKAAIQGHVAAQLSLGRAYFNGEGVPLSQTEGVKWFRCAAEQGAADAQYSLADAYYFGEGIREDESEAVKWYQRAAEQGHILAQWKLGCSYHFGLSVTKDHDEGEKWVGVAAKQSNSDEELLKWGEAEKWIGKVAMQGNAEAQYTLGLAFSVGIGQKDDAEAVRWFKAAAEGGHAEAQYELSRAYRRGKMGVAQDDAEAMVWLRMAAKHGHETARRLLELRSEVPKALPAQPPNNEADTMNNQLASRTEQTKPAVNDVRSQPSAMVAQYNEPRARTLAEMRAQSRQARKALEKQTASSSRAILILWILLGVALVAMIILNR